MNENCNDKSPLNYTPNLDKIPSNCEDKYFPNQRDVNDCSLNWLKDTTNQKIGLGSSGLCDPMQKGHIINDSENPDRSTIYRYSK